MSNFGDDDPVGKLIFAIGNLGKHLRNLVYTKRIKNTKIVNPAVLMGLCGTLLLLMEKRMEIWGPDPVHASALAHSTMAERKAERKAEEMDTSSVLNMRVSNVTGARTGKARASGPTGVEDGGIPTCTQLFLKFHICDLSSVLLMCTRLGISAYTEFNFC